MTPIFPAIASDLRFIVANLSDQNRGEQRAFGLTDAQLVSRLTKLMDRGHSEAVTVDGQPAAALGIADGYTWFVATEAFFSLGIKGVRYARERMATLRKVEGKALTSLSRSPHPGTARWFKALGFVENCEHNVDGERMFVYL